MKKTIILLLALLVLTAVMISCGKGTDKGTDTTADAGTNAVTTAEATTDAGTTAVVTTATTTAEETKAEIIKFIEDTKSEYKLIRPSNYTKGLPQTDVCIDLLSAIKEFGGITLESGDDFVMRGTDMNTLNDEKEILIGATNRNESAKALEGLTSRDYTIQIINKKIVIIGGSVDATIAAVKRFQAMFFSATQPSLILRENFRYDYKYDYICKNHMAGDEDIGKYTIVAPSASSALANYLAIEIEKATGILLPVANTSATESEFEILVGDTGRAESGETALAAGEYIIKQSGKKLIVKGSAGVYTEFAVKKLAECFAKETFTLPATDKVAVTTASSVKLLDLNVYSTGYENNSVDNRYPRLAKLVTQYAPDVICLQDVSPTWYKNITNGHGDTAAIAGGTSAYSIVGIGRQNDVDNQGNYNSVRQSILFNKTKYTLVDSGTFWLSETPDWESIGWDGYSRCICTWVRLKDNATGGEFVVLNTQLDFNGQLANENGAALICEKAASFGLPAIFAGDFQKTSTSAAYKGTVSSGFTDVFAIATVSEGGATTNGAFGNDKNNTTASDFVFTTTGDFVVRKASLAKDKYDNEYVSNHWGILVEADY